MAAGAKSCLVSSWRISHFGINPVRGGSPPSERRIRGVRAVRAGAFVQEVASMLILVDLFSLKVRNAEVVIIRYVIRARSVREDENCRTRIIHPRCAMDEYARILRSWVWFRPPHPPIRVEMRARRINKFWFAGKIW